MERFKPIPNWVYTGTLPAFFDTESGTAIEQTARLHGYIKSLIDDYNKFTAEIIKATNEFMDSTDKDQEEFKKHIDKIVHDYIAMLDEKIKQQDSKIAEIKTDTVKYATELVNDIIRSGEIEIASVYDEETKELNIGITVGGDE